MRRTSGRFAFEQDGSFIYNAPKPPRSTRTGGLRAGGLAAELTTVRREPANLPKGRQRNRSRRWLGASGSSFNAAATALRVETVRWHRRQPLKPQFVTNVRTSHRPPEGCCDTNVRVVHRQDVRLPNPMHPTSEEWERNFGKPNYEGGYGAVRRQFQSRT